jgi:hypothetical protein
LNLELDNGDGIRAMILNSEFTAQNTDSYLLAAADSKADDKYELLTIVLHEVI